MCPGVLAGAMPECVSVSEFVQEVQEDWSSPTTSSFTSKMLSCRNTVYLLEEVSAVTHRGGQRSGGDSGSRLVAAEGLTGAIHHLVISLTTHTYSS